MSNRLEIVNNDGDPSQKELGEKIPTTYISDIYDIKPQPIVQFPFSNRDNAPNSPLVCPLSTRF